MTASKSTKKNFYAVAVGSKPGLYDKWDGPFGAFPQVDGFPKAKYKGFSTREEAIVWLNEMGVHLRGLELKKNDIPDASIPCEIDQDVEKGEPGTSPPVDVTRELEKGTVIMYSDGGCLNNPGPGGYGVVLLYESKRKELYGGFHKTTNNRMELTGCIEGLKALKYPCPVVLHTDSRYVVNGISKGWAERWKKKKWMRSINAPAENYDLWDQLLSLCEVHQVTFKWVKGHAGNTENERCDRLAAKGINEIENLKHDENYESGRTTITSTMPSTYKQLF